MLAKVCTHLNILISKFGVHIATKKDKIKNMHIINIYIWAQLFKTNDVVS